MDFDNAVAKLEQQLYRKPVGFVANLAVAPGGQKDGLDYGPLVLQIVVLDSDCSTIAWRRTSDAGDGDWRLGSVTGVLQDAAAWLYEIADLVANPQF